MTGTGTIAIRRLGAGEAGLLAEVAEAVFDAPIDPARAAASLAEPGHILFVALDGTRVVGQCAGVIHRHPDKPDALYVGEIGVAPAFRRRGIARRLLAALLASGRAAGCAEAWLGTEHDNGPARALYARSGGEAEPFLLYAFDLRRAGGPAEGEGVASGQQEARA